MAGDKGMRLTLVQYAFAWVFRSFNDGGTDGGHWWLPHGRIWILQAGLTLVATISALKLCSSSQGFVFIFTCSNCLNAYL